MSRVKEAINIKKVRNTSKVKNLLKYSFLLVTFFGAELINNHLQLSAIDTLTSIIKRGELRVGTDVGYMPFEMKDKKGKVVGYDIDLAKLIAKELGVKLTIVNTEWDGIIPALLTNKFDMIIAGMTITQKRNIRVNFSDPYIVVGQTILINNSLASKVKSYKDLNNKKYKVVSKLGTTGEQAAKRLLFRAQYKSYQDSQPAAMEVVNGRADAFVYDLPFNAVFYSTKAKGKVVFLDQPFTYEPLSIAVRRGDPDILNWLNNFLRQIKNDGREKKINQRWFASTDWYKKVQ